MKFADYDPPTVRHASSDVAQNSSRIIGVVQDHRNKGRAGLHACGLQRGRVRDDPLNLSDAALGLQAFQIGQGVSRAVERVDDARGSHTFSER